MKLKKMISAVCAAALSVSALCTTTAVTASAADFDPNSASTTDIVADMGVGWNLGNTLDASGKSGLDAETYWQTHKLKTTQAMIDAIKNQGFNTVRIPVSWHDHVSGSDNTIDSAWINRVKEVVDYCYNDDMYVILNVHHDNGSAKYGVGSNEYYPDSAHYAASSAYIESVWSQIADYFGDYDDHLVFETLNEPRLRDTNYEWYWSSVDSTMKDSMNCINKLNQVAVDAIRQNDNNKDRLIMCPGYAASLDGATSSEYKIPTDISGNNNRLIVSVHGYSPYNFAMNANGTSTYTTAIKNELNSIFTKLKSNFTNKGISVVIGEFGATNKQNTNERVKWVTDYLNNAKAQNICCCVWDNDWFEEYDSNGTFKLNSEYHGILNRQTLKFYDQTYTDAMTNLYQKYPNISSATVTVADQTYTGKALKPKLTVKIGATTLTEGVDYTATYSNNVNMGVATYKITGAGNYKGTNSGTFTIYKTADQLKYSTISDQVWTGKSITPAVTVKDGTKVLVKGTDYTVAYSFKENVGTAKATIRLKGYYQGTKVISYKILPKKQRLNTLTGVKGGVRITYAGTRVASGYQIKYSTKADMSDAKTIWVRKGTSTLKTITGLKKGTKYYFTVRTYSTVDGVKYAGAWAAKHSCVAK